MIQTCVCERERRVGGRKRGREREGEMGRGRDGEKGREGEGKRERLEMKQRTQI